MSGVLALTDIWHEKWTSQNLSIQWLEKTLIDEVPYTYLLQVSKKVNEAWQIYGPSIEKKWKLSSPVAFSEWLLTSNTTPVSQMLQLDIFTNHSLIGSSLFPKSDLKRERELASNDASMGYLREVDLPTLELISQLLSTQPEAFFKMMDGLGVDPLEQPDLVYEQDTPSLKQHALKFLQNWMNGDSNATLKRLELEAQQAGLSGLSRILRAIPPASTPQVDAYALIQNHPLYSVASRYWMMEIAKRASTQILDWDHAAAAICKDFRLLHQVSGWDALWMRGNVPQAKVQSYLTNDEEMQQIQEQLEEERRSGTFLLKSPGGISIGQILYLANSVAQMDKQMNTAQLLQLLFPTIRYDRRLSFAEFLFLYWQSPSVEHYTLDQFYLQLISLLTTKNPPQNKPACEDPNVFHSLEQSYHTLRPKRAFSHALDLANSALAPSSKGPSEQLGSLEEREICVVCMDESRTHMAYPCGHYDFCLNCISSINSCGTCRAEIKDRVRVIRS